MRQRLRQLFADTIVDLDPIAMMQPVLARYRERARAGDPFLVLAYGKAARPMTAAVVAGLPGARLRGLVVPPDSDPTAMPPFEVIPGGHPIPNEGSLRAGARALELAHGVQADETVLFLASGGGSAMLEWPIDPSVTLAEVQILYRALLGCGAPILAVNQVRRQLSAVKGGRLAHAARSAREHVPITIVDTPHHMSWAVASGPSHPDTNARSHALETLDRFALWSAVPARLHQPLRTGTLAPAPRHDSSWPPRFTCDVATNDDARAAMRRHLVAAGLGIVEDVDMDDRCDDERTCEDAADELLRGLHDLRQRHPGQTVAVVAGGELSVPLPANPGTGGRNQQFVLHCAGRIEGKPITVLSCGTDGVDGNSPAAGALVDGTTMARARALGLDVHEALRRCDAFPLLHTLGDTVVTGPTGTNVRDLRILVHAG